MPPVITDHSYSLRGLLPPFHHILNHYCSVSNLKNLITLLNGITILHSTVDNLSRTVTSK